MVWAAWIFGCSSAVPEPPPPVQAPVPAVPYGPAMPEGWGDYGDRRDAPQGDLDVIGAFEPVSRPCEGFPTPGVYTYDGKGADTHALLYVPKGAGPHDLVVVLHGGDSSPERILMQTRFVEQAMEGGFAVLAPTGEAMGKFGPHWNTGKFEDKFEDRGIDPRDDVAYLDRLTARAKADVCAERVLAAGFSNGGQMVHRWGCEGKQVDAVLSAAGELLVDPKTCSSRAVLGYVGTLDKVFDGSPLEGSGQPSAVETMELWAKINRCSDKPPEIRESGDTRCRVWKGCRAPTQLCVVEGFPHGWPAPWSRKKPPQCNATADGMRWFADVGAAPEPAPTPDPRPAPDRRDRRRGSKPGRG